MNADNPREENLMKSWISICCGALLAAFVAVPAFAQPGPGMGGGMGGGMGPGPGCGQAGGPACGAAPRDCSKAPNPEQCKTRQEARQQAFEACKDKAGPERRDCMRDHMPPVDCSKSRNPQRCEARQKAQDACKGKVGPERRQCMSDALKAK